MLDTKMVVLTSTCTENTKHLKEILRGALVQCLLTVGVIHYVIVSEKVLFKEQNTIDCSNSNLEKPGKHLEFH